MTQVQFNLDLETIKEKIMNSQLDEFIKASVVVIFNEYMEMEREKFIQAEKHERSENRRDYRNGYYTRELLMSFGRVELRVPRTRSGDFSTELFERYQRTEQSFLLAILEMYVKGISTRNVTKVIKKLNGESISKSMVSDLTKTLQKELVEWSERDLEDVDYCPYVFLDATYTKVRENNRVISKALYIAKGLTEDGRRTILGLQIGSEESFNSWSDFLSNLKKRGLKSPRLIISDAHEGLKQAVQLEFNGASWQRCLVHFKRNIIGVMPKKIDPEVKHDFFQIFKEINPDKARARKTEFINKYENDKSLIKAIDILENGFEDAIQFMNELAHRHPYLRSTNALERINQLIKARAKVIKTFPNDDSLFRIAASILLEYEEQQKGKNRLF